MSAQFITELYNAKRGDKIVVAGSTYVVADTKGAPQNIRAVRLDGGDELITHRDDLVRGFALLQEAGVEVPTLRPVEVKPDTTARTVHTIREERRALDLQMLSLSQLARTLGRDLARRDAELKQAAFTDKVVTNDKLREAAYKLLLTSDEVYLDLQRRADELGDSRTRLQIEIDALRREFREAEREHEAATLGRRHAA